MKCPNCGAVHPGKVCPNCGSGRNARYPTNLKSTKPHRSNNIFVIAIVISAFGLMISVSIKSWFSILFGVLLAGSIIGLRRNNKKIPSTNTSISQSPAHYPVNTTISQYPDSAMQPKEKTTVPYKSENHHIAGTSFRQETIEQLLDEYSVPNSLYSCTKKELIEMNLEGTRIYSYEYTSADVSLVEEPENPHDPNAIKVLVDNFHVGYIKKGSCSHVKKILHSGNILRIKAEVCGGKYKCLVSEWDKDENDTVYDVIKSDIPYFVTVNIQYKI